MTWGTGHWCVAVVYETLSPQINVRWGKEEEEEEERMAGSHHCRPSRSPCRTERGGAADSAVKKMNIHTSRSHRLLSSVWERILFSSLPALIFPTQILPSGPASEEVDNHPPSLGISTRLKTALPSFWHQTQICFNLYSFKGVSLIAMFCFRNAQITFTPVRWWSSGAE